MNLQQIVMNRKEFIFKEKWLSKAAEKIPQHSIAELIVLAVEYGIYGRHEKVTDISVMPFLDMVKADIDSQRKNPAKKEKMNIPPKIEEVIQYINDNNLNVDPYQFWNFYESKGWFVGKNKMKNWHSAVATWIRRNQVIYNNGERQQSNIIGKVADILAD